MQKDIKSIPRINGTICNDCHQYSLFHTKYEVDYCPTCNKWMVDEDEIKKLNLPRYPSSLKCPICKNKPKLNKKRKVHICRNCNVHIYTSGTSDV